MYDVILMAIVDTWKDLFNQKSAISFSELSTSDDFIEKLSALADFLNQVVPFVIFEKLIHLNDIGMIQFLQNINLVEEHALFIVIHVGLFQNFDGTLGASTSMYTHTDFTESSIS